MSVGSLSTTMNSLKEVMPAQVTSPVAAMASVAPVSSVHAPVDPELRRKSLRMLGLASCASVTTPAPKVSVRSSEKVPGSPTRSITKYLPPIDEVNPTGNTFGSVVISLKYTSTGFSNGVLKVSVAPPTSAVPDWTPEAVPETPPIGMVEATQVGSPPSAYVRSISRP